MSAPPPPEARQAPGTTETEAGRWSHLHAACSAALELSRQVHGALLQGAAAAALIPLLRREAELAREIQRSIASHGAAGRQQTPPPEHAELMPQMAALVAMEEENHRLLSSRGVRLSGPGTPRAIPRKRPRPR